MKDCKLFSIGVCLSIMQVLEEKILTARMLHSCGKPCNVKLLGLTCCREQLVQHNRTAVRCTVKLLGKNGQAKACIQLSKCRCILQGPT